MVNGLVVSSYNTELNKLPKVINTLIKYTNLYLKE